MQRCVGTGGGRSVRGRHTGAPAPHARTSVALATAEVAVAGDATTGHVEVGKGRAVEVAGLRLRRQGFGALLEHAGLELVLLGLVRPKELGRLADRPERVRVLFERLVVL